MCLTSIRYVMQSNTQYSRPSAHTVASIVLEPGAPTASMTFVDCHVVYNPHHKVLPTNSVCASGENSLGKAVPADSLECATASKHMPTPAVATLDAFPQRRSYRRSCHGTLPEQQQSLRDSWDHAVVSRKSLRDSWDLKQLIAVAAEESGSTCSKFADACGSHQQDQQQEVKLTTSLALLGQSAPAAEQAAAEADCDAEVEVAVKALGRPSSPFAAPEVQACTCYRLSGRLCCKVHSRSLKLNTGSPAPKAKAAVSTVAAANAVQPVHIADVPEAPNKKATLKANAKKVVKAVVEGLSFCSFSPAAVPGMGGVHINQC